MSQPELQNNGIFTSLRSRLARAIAPSPGDEKTERWDGITVEPITENDREAFRFTAYNGTRENPTSQFSKTVDYITLNKTSISLSDELRLDGGVAFEYFWNPETASIDIYH
jgi:hypothetical protein